MKNFKKTIAIILCLGILFCLAACGGNKGDMGTTADEGNISSTQNSTDSAESAKLTIAYQGGIGYAPVHVLEAKKLIEKNYKEATGKDVTVKFQKLDSGADINTGIIGGTIDIGCMGIAPAV